MNPPSSIGSPLPSSSTESSTSSVRARTSLHVGAQLVAAQDRELVAGLARVLDRVVEAPELAVHRLAVADALDQPELLEVGDVAEVPGKRAEDRRVDGVELLVGERLDQQEGALARLGEAVGDPLTQIGLGRRRDGPRLPRCRPATRKRAEILCAPMQSQGAIALVAGGASGLGEASARRLHADGATVVIGDLNAEKGEALAGELGERASFVEANVLEPDQVQAAVDAATAARRAADLGLLRGDRLGPAHGLQAGPARPRDLLQRDQGQPDRHLQRPAARRHGDGRQRARRGRRARRLRQHRLDRGVRRPDRTGRLLGFEGRDRRDDAARRA